VSEQAESRPRFYDRPSFTAAESNRNRGISNCNVIRDKSKRGWRGTEREKNEEWVEDREKEEGRERERNCRTRDKECGIQGVTRISFDGITWRLRAGTVIALYISKYQQDWATPHLPRCIIFRGIEGTAVYPPSFIPLRRLFYLLLNNRTRSQPAGNYSTSRRCDATGRTRRIGLLIVRCEWDS